MTVDRFGAHNLTPKRPLPPLPDDFVEWKGMRVPRALEFRWQDLVRVAATNGLPLSLPLLHKWRDWRFLPPPMAGGPVARGSGKGQIWSKAAGRLVAWISYWRNRRLTYDTLRLAMWPWKPTTFDRQRLRDVLASLRRFVVWDERFEDAVLQRAEAAGERDAELDSYAAVLFAADRPSKREREHVLEFSPLSPDHPGYATTVQFLERLTFEDMKGTIWALREDDLRAFIRAFREAMAPHDARLQNDLWEDPLRIARIVVRNAHRYWLKLAEERASGS